MQGIEIPIGAPLGQLDKDLKGATTQISNFATTTLGKFALINNAKFTFGQNYIKEADRLAGKSKGLGDTLGAPLVKASNSAAFALQNLGRVAQDAPFGFIGIQNNLNPLLESFSRLKAETGGTGSALKALGQTLIGPAGLGIALSVVSSAILFYQQYQQKANKTTNDAKKVSEDYISTLSQLNQVRVGGASAAQSELTTLDLLFKQYKNTSNSLDTRKNAYEELQKLYPAYFGNLKFENEISAKTTEAYGRLTTSILATARARAAYDLISDNSKRKLENEQKILDLTTKLSIDKAKADKARAVNLASIGAAGQEGTGSIVAATNEIKALKEVEATQLQINNLKTDSNILTQKNLQLEKSALNEKSKIDSQFNDKALKETKKKLTESEKLELDYQKRLVQIKVESQQFAADLIIGGIQREADKTKINIDFIDTDALDLAVRQSEVAAKAIVDKFAAIKAPLLTPFQNLNLYIKDNILPQLSTSFKTFFDEMLIRGKFSFAALGESIKNTFLSVLASEATQGVLNLLGSKGGKTEKGGGLIAGVFGLLKGAKKAAPLADIAKSTGGIMGTGASLVTPVAASGGALLPILAGVAAVASIASLFKKKKSPEPQTSAVISTSAAGSAQDFGGGRVVFEISGPNLVGVLNRAGAKLTRFGP